MNSPKDILCDVMPKIKSIFKLSFLVSFLFVFLLPLSGHAQELVNDKIEIYKAKVISVTPKSGEEIPGYGLNTNIEEIKAIILEGTFKDRVVNFNNDFTPLTKNQIFYLNHTTDINGNEFYSLSEPYRLNIIYLLLGIFILLTVLVGGKAGFRGLISLGISLVLIVYALVPFILSGYSPVFVSIIVASFIIILGSYITHGFNKTTTSAVLGMILTVVVTGALAYFTVLYGKFSGFETEEAIYLNLNNKGSIDLVGILIAGILIGLLGVLYDVAINQAIFVKELHDIAPDVSKDKIFTRALHLGRAHIGALVDTLAIAYVGASLPLLLLFSNTTNVALTLNREIFAVEIVRILIGSIGLILAVPVTTFIATLLLIKKDKDIQKIPTEIQEENLKHYNHSH